MKVIKVLLAPPISQHSIGMVGCNEIGLHGPAIKCDDVEPSQADFPERREEAAPRRPRAGSRPAACRIGRSPSDRTRCSDALGQVPPFAVAIGTRNRDPVQEDDRLIRSPPQHSAKSDLTVAGRRDEVVGKSNAIYYLGVTILIFLTRLDMRKLFHTLFDASLVRNEPLDGLTATFRYFGVLVRTF